MHQLYANISTENEASIALFTKFGFQKIGTKKDWTLVNGIYKDEAIFQLINTSTLKYFALNSKKIITIVSVVINIRITDLWRNLSQSNFF